MRRLVIFAMMVSFLMIGNVQAEQKYTQAELDATYNSITSSDIQAVLQYLQENPDKINEINAEIQANPELKQYYNKLSNDKNMQNKVLKEFSNNPQGTAKVTEKMMNDSATTKDVLIKMNKDTKAIDEIEKDPKMKREIIRDMNNKEQMKQNLEHMMNAQFR